MHPAEAILDAVVAAIQTQVGTTVSVFLHRAESITEADMPCVCVNFGDDTPGSAISMQEYGSSLRVLLTARAIGDTEADVKSSLLTLRSACHRAMAATLASAWGVQYGGSSAPELVQSARMVGEMTSIWAVQYTMDISNPE